MTRRQTLSLFLLLLFLGIGLVPFFGPPAPPLPNEKAQIVVLSEDEDTDFNKGFFRTVLRGEEEGTRSDSFMAVISLEAFHDHKYNVQLTKASRQFNSRTQKNSLYLMHSSLTI